MSGFRDQTHPVSVRALLAIALGAMGLLATLGWAAKADANTPVNEFFISPSSTQAGGHPDIEAMIWVSNSSTQPNPFTGCECHDLKNIVIDGPAGTIPNVYATPRCDAADFGANQCPIDSQIGIVKVGISNDAPGTTFFFDVYLAVYNLIPHPNQAGLVGFYTPALASPIFIVVDSRTESDYGLAFTVSGITHIANGVSVIEQTFWGVPADHSHDALRYKPAGCDPEGLLAGVPKCEGGAISNAPLAPFISAPTICGSPLEVGVRTESYDLGTDSASGLFPATTGCDQLSFNPSLFAQPTGRQTDTASGLDADLKVPAAESPIAPSPSHIRAATVTLPEGFSINAGAADGKESCSAAQARVGFRHEAAQCPESSKVGSLTIESTALPAPMHGYIYLADPLPGDPYRVWLIADGFGQHVKLPPGSVHADPQTGQLTTSFQNLPQFPFTDFNMHFFGSERGLLATPERCGTYPVKSTFTPWDDALPEQTSTQFFEVDEGPDGEPCPTGPRPFAPSFKAGVSDQGAGHHAPLTFDISRTDGDQNLTGVEVATPPGFAATLKGVPYCPQTAIDQLEAPGLPGRTEQAFPACPQASQVGTASAGAGAGTHPVYVPGKVYLAGPYKGAPLSLIAVIPAVSGPYDLGVVAVRSAIRVNAATAQITAASDPLPLIVEGIPLRTRFIRVSIDRPGFALNPTNCDPFAINATLAGDEGARSAQGTHFQVANCAALPFRPKLAVKLTGGVRRRGHPAIKAVLTARPGEANARRLSVALPKGELLDNSHIGTVCTRVQFAANKCPDGSRLGTAEAITPLLDQPLKGAVYLRSSSHELPDLAMDLEGQVDIEVVGRVDTIRGGSLRTTIESAPDAPVTKFTLNLAGGKRGLLQNSESLCRKPKYAIANMTGQNGIRVNTRTKLRVKCGSRKAG